MRFIIFFNTLTTLHFIFVTTFGYTLGIFWFSRLWTADTLGCTTGGFWICFRIIKCFWLTSIHCACTNFLFVKPACAFFFFAALQPCIHFSKTFIHGHFFFTQTSWIGFYYFVFFTINFKFIFVLSFGLGQVTRELIAFIGHVFFSNVLGKLSHVT